MGRGSTYGGKRLIMGDTAYIPHPEYCDLCKSQGLQVEAVYDGKTVHGPWAYMCENHFGAMGVGLGTGRGQRLIVGEKPRKDSSNDGFTEVDDEDDTDETIASNASNGVAPHPTNASEDVEPSPEDTQTQPEVESPTEELVPPVTEIESVLPAIEKEAEKPAQKRRRLRAERRKKAFAEQITEADYRRTHASKDAAPAGVPAELEEPVEEQVPYVMKMDWGDLSR
jgi:hypothetical protein